MVALDDLLALVHAHPEADEPRLVYADALLECGDPRGEFIALQLDFGDRKRGKEARKRTAELFSAHGRQWLGPLWDLVLPDFTFERGFLATCRVLSTQVDKLRAVEGHPLWATVHTLSGSLRIGCHPSLTALRRLTVDFGRAEKHEDMDAPWATLLEAELRPITELSLRPSRHAGARELSAQPRDAGGARRPRSRAFRLAFGPSAASHRNAVAGVGQRPLAAARSGSGNADGLPGGGACERRRYAGYACTWRRPRRTQRSM